MDDGTKNLWEVAISATRTVGVAIGAIWVYFRFWREGVHRPRIEFNIECSFLGTQGDNRVASFVVSANNKGNVEHRFTRITLRVRGIAGTDTLVRRQDERLDFPASILKAELVPDEFGYYFVRPGVVQLFTFTTTVPANMRFLLARAAFKYQRSIDLHTCERVFEVSQKV